jgi:thiamine transport system permease protein
MANRALPLILSGLIAALVLGTALVLALRADSFTLRPAEWAALTFTLKQAALSALASTLLAIPLARALNRRRFPGRGAMIALMGAPFLLPTVVAVVGMLAIYGRNGVANQALALLHLPPVSIFGLQGVVLTNVFFNLPLATRILLNGWSAIPAERFRLAETLGLPPSASFRHIELPMLRDLLPGAFVVVFLLCMSSFVISLTFGGGPRATTLELALYQALRFDFDLGRAALLAALQFAVCAAAVLIAGRLTLPSGLGTGQDRQHVPTATHGRLTDTLLLTATLVFLMLPLGAVLLMGLPGLSTLPAAVWQAALRSVVIAVASASLATAAGLALALAVAHRAPGARWIELAAMLPMAASGLVLGTGLFLILHPVMQPERAALPVTILVNATIALPFLYRLLLPQARELVAGYDRLCTTLNLQGAARLRHVTLPRLARPLGLGSGIAAALSMGDLGVIALFAGDQTATLPLMVQRLAGAYRVDQAAAASLLLVALSFALFFICDKGGRHAAP